MSILDYLLLFFIFSVIGFTYEVILHYFQHHKYQHSGILQGPYCFIYGLGAVIITMYSYENPLTMFFVGAATCFILEVPISYILDYLHLPRWDYSKLPYSLQGRTCLYSLEFFGFMAAIYNSFLKDGILRIITAIPTGLELFLLIIILTILIFDIAYTYFRTTKA